MLGFRLSFPGRVSLLVAAVLVAGLAAVWAAGPARAEVVHEPLFELAEVPAKGPHGEPVAIPGPLSGVGSLAVDSGHVWLAEGSIFGKSRVDEFDAKTGAFIAQPVHLESSPDLAHPSCYGYGCGDGVAVGHGPGEAAVYVAGEQNGVSVVSVFDETGALKATWNGAATPEGSFGVFTGFKGETVGTITDVAVDNSTSPLNLGSGDVFVEVGNPFGSRAEKPRVIDVFHPEADGEERYVGQITGPSAGEPFEGIPGMAVDEANGDLFVTEHPFGGHGGSAVDVFEPTGLGSYAFVRKIQGPPPTGTFQSLGDPVAVDSATGEVYVTEGIGEAFRIDEFSVAGAYLGHVANPPVTYSLAVKSESEPHDLYTTSVVYGPDVVIPDVTTGPVSAQTTRSVTLNGTVNPVGAGEASCQFDWGPTPALGKVAPCSAKVPNGTEAVAVHAVLSEGEFERNASYYYRLQATNEQGTNHGEVGQDQQFATIGAVVRSASVLDVSADSATFEASIDPGSTPTSYYFEYGPSAAYGQQAPAAPGSSIGSGVSFVEVPAVHVSGLPAGSVVHYRVVAVSEPPGGEVETLYSPDRTFTTEAAKGSFALPDGRQWELVSQANKLGALVEPHEVGAVVQAAADGGAIAYKTSSPTESAPAGGYAHEDTVFSTHGAGGWSSLDISVPNIAPVRPTGGAGREFQIFSEDLSRVAVEPPWRVFTPLSPEASESTPYLRTDYLEGDVADVCGSGCYRPLVTGKAGFANVPSGTVFGDEPEGFCPKYIACGPKFQGASPDLSHIVLSSSAQLTATPAPTGGEGLYEWSEGRLQLLDELPAGEEGPAILAGSSYAGMGVRRSVSDDGQRVVMEGGAAGGDGVYLREVATAARPQGETVRLDVPQGGSGPSENPVYMDASADGSRVFFLDSGRLMADSSGSADLYEYNVNAPAGSRLTDLSVDSNPGQAADVQMVVGASEDGSYVYFAAAGVLAPGAVEGECPGVAEHASPTSKGCNLYVRHDGVTRLVAVVPSTDVWDWSTHLAVFSVDSLFGRVSPDGQWFAFMSDGELTGYDTHDALNGQPDAEVYVYDAASGALACASCNPTGARPVGAKYLKGNGDEIEGWLAARVPAWNQPANSFGSSAAHQPRYLSDSGRLFFDSTDALVPQDVNGVEDVYEWEPPGVGSCSTVGVTFSPRSGGCVDLLSSGTSPEPSEFIDASETGGDVFIRTAARLAPADYDAAYDIYDVRECTGVVPCPVVVPQPPACTTESSCKTPPSPQPALYGAPASATFSGVGNVVPSTSPPVVQGRAKSGSKGKSKRGRGRSVCRKRAKRRCAKAGKAGRVGRRASRMVETTRGGGR